MAEKKTYKNTYQNKYKKNIPMGYIFRKISNAWQKGLNTFLVHYNLTHVQFILLATLFHSITYRKQTLTQVELATLSDSDVMMTSKVVRTLEKKGFISRENNPMDARSKKLLLTTKGITLIKKILPMVGKEDKKFFSHLPEKEKIKELLYFFYLQL